jgi:FkbH-like protein
MSNADAVGGPAHVQASARWRAYESGEKAPTNFTVGIASSFTVDGVVPMLGCALLGHGFRPEMRLSGYDQIFQTCFDHRAHFGGDPDAIVLLWRIEDWLAQEFARSVGGDRAALLDACARIDEFGQAVGHLRRAFKGTIVVSLPPFPDATAANLLDLDTPINAGSFVRAIVTHAEQRLTGVGNVRLIDLDALQRHFGAQRAFDSRTWYLYRQPYAPAFLYEVGRLLGRIIKSTRTAAKKCIVLDCDNTLWGGIVGEDGLQGIAIGDDFPGSAYRDLQRYLLHLRSEGVLLAIASKNNEADVWAVFEQHDGMVLRHEHISAARINWETKAANLKEIADELNIGIDSLVFLDDNPFEIEQMRSLLPEVVSILLDEEPAEMVDAIKDMHLFDKLEVTQEDSLRADMMLAERKRSQFSKVLSSDDFIAALELRLDIAEARPDQLGRIAQLTNKTNQFNLTTVRRSLEQIEAINSSPDWRVYALRVADRFGDYGLVGVAIVELLDGDRLRLDTFLLSCRVLGRGVETAFLSEVVGGLRKSDASVVDASYIPTAKNGLAANFLADHGFLAVDETQWQLPAGAVISKSKTATAKTPQTELSHAASPPAPSPSLATSGAQ